VGCPFERWIRRHRRLPRPAGAVYRARHRKLRYVSRHARAQNTWSHCQIIGTAGIRCDRCFGADCRDRPGGQRHAPPAKVMFLLGFFILGVALGPFPDSDAPAALLTGFLGVAGMAIQNTVQRVHFGYSADDTHDRKYDSTRARRC
jgi:hypothetical protein